jgi:hypothetical protein
MVVVNALALLALLVVRARRPLPCPVVAAKAPRALRSTTRAQSGHPRSRFALAYFTCTAGSSQALSPELMPPPRVVPISGTASVELRNRGAGSGTEVLEELRTRGIEKGGGAAQGIERRRRLCSSSGYVKRQQQRLGALKAAKARTAVAMA